MRCSSGKGSEIEPRKKNSCGATDLKMLDENLNLKLEHFSIVEILTNIKNLLTLHNFINFTISKIQL